MNSKAFVFPSLLNCITIFNVEKLMTIHSSKNACSFCHLNYVLYLIQENIYHNSMHIKGKFCEIILQQHILNLDFSYRLFQLIQDHSFVLIASVHNIKEVEKFIKLCVIIRKFEL